jgi:hypothetical protein
MFPPLRKQERRKLPTQLLERLPRRSRTLKRLVRVQLTQTTKARNRIQNFPLEMRSRTRNRKLEKKDRVPHPGQARLSGIVVWDIDTQVYLLSQRQLESGPPCPFQASKNSSQNRSRQLPPRGAFLPSVHVQRRRQKGLEALCRAP